LLRVAVVVELVAMAVAVQEDIGQERDFPLHLETHIRLLLVLVVEEETFQ
jgi:hypothetical protein